MNIEEIGNQHFYSSKTTPMRTDAFELSDEEKIEKIKKHFQAIMETLGLDLNDDSLSGTPERVAKMYVKEIFSGLNPENKPDVTLFENKFEYKEMLVEKNIIFHSNCEHHFVPIYGKAHVAYIPNEKVIGLSKINRTVQYFSKRPQVQERLTVQIAEELIQMLDTQDVAVVLDADHMCVASRGVNDTHSSTVTAHFSGAFKHESVKKEFLSYIK
ncbi:GTP cyclohydrolase I FolE [Aureibacter tunicatorum]|uniref:GTP cyclohydrolase 1 n=1 Tax=Aureibacter tunicatorum TaxID=866807 RepID=A0AAE3XS62_9BACT|nr:GTP cyclohydrolase I FolE [Aureibacter tunicatorum]MDR6240916.1 GTP cyclohydrolase I [Aureibacter tunicatorum]BDD03696.1 GTP cyclohydrolase 1 [Aureibacter tunicatorum]